MQVEVDKLAIEPLRGLASAAAGNAFTEYMLAIAQIQQELKEAEAAAAKKTQLTFEIVVAMAIAVATPLTGGAAAAIAGPALQATLGTAIAGNTQTFLKIAGVKSADAISDTILKAAASDSITRLAKSYSASDGQKIIGEAIKSFTKKVSVAGHDTVDACTYSYVKQIETACQASKNQLDISVAGATGFSQLLQIYHSYSTATKQAYYDGLKKQVDAFKKTVAPFIVRKAQLNAKGELHDDNPDQLYPGENIVKMDAYGRIRFARIDFSPSRSPLTSPTPIYIFKEWIPPEAEQAAEAVAKRLLDPARIKGHIPDPGVP